MIAFEKSDLETRGFATPKLQILFGTKAFFKAHILLCDITVPNNKTTATRDGHFLDYGILVNIVVFLDSH